MGSEKNLKLAPSVNSNFKLDQISTEVAGFNQVEVSTVELQKTELIF